MNSQVNTKLYNLITVAMSLLIYVPGSDTGNYIRLAVLLVSFFLAYTKNSNVLSGKSQKIGVLMVVGVFIPVSMVFLFEHTLNTGLVTHELVRMLYCSLLIMMVCHMVVDFRAIYFSAVIALIPNFVIQVMQYLKNESVFDFILQNYVEEGASTTHLDLARLSGSSFRSGSIFLNPNVYMVIPLIALCVFLYQDRKKSNIINTALIICCCLSCFLTGSRTSIIVVVVILLVYLVRYASLNRKIVFIVLIAASLYEYGAFILENSRAIDVGSTGSLEVKINSYIWYFQGTASMPLYWLTGSLGSSRFSSMDSEWGHIYAWYGVFGLYWYIEYYKLMWQRNKHIKFYSRIITIVCALVHLLQVFCFACRCFHLSVLFHWRRLRSREV